MFRSIRKFLNSLKPYTIQVEVWGAGFSEVSVTKTGVFGHEDYQHLATVQYKFFTQRGMKRKLKGWNQWNNCVTVVSQSSDGKIIMAKQNI